MSFNGPLELWLDKRAGLLSFQEVTNIVQETAEALQQLHNQQKIHGDINPSNILLSLDGLNEERVSLPPSTRSGKNIVVNSQLMYTAPEQWNGEAVPATDQYALAVMAYELLTGRPPFQGTPKQVMDLQINVQPAAPSTLNKRVPPAIDGVVLSALAKRPEDRFPSISAFARALGQAIQPPEPSNVGQQDMLADDILRATLLISKIEAEKGTLRTIAIPSGRRITVSVPKGVYDGQILRREGFSDRSPIGAAGVLFLTIAVSQTEAGASVGDRKKPKKFRTSLRRKYIAIANGPARRRAAILVLVPLLALIILASAGFGLFLHFRTISVPIPYPPHIGSLALDDTLRDNIRGYNWPEDAISSDGGSCQFRRGAYHVVMIQPRSFHYCIAGNTGYDNFTYEVRMTIIKGDEGGIIFRADGLNSKFYYFRVGQDGSYDLYLYVDSLGAHAKRLADGTTPAIHTGLNLPNLLAVVACNNALDLYVNNQKITRVNNNAYSQGQIGVAAAFDTDLTEVVFSNAKVWAL